MKKIFPDAAQSKSNESKSNQSIGLQPKAEEVVTLDFNKLSAHSISNVNNPSGSISANVEVHYKYNISTSLKLR